MCAVEETRKQRFERLATRRVNKILNDLRLLGNLSNKSAYDYSEDEINKIFSEIDKTLRIAKAKFHFIKKTEFKF